MAQVNDIAQLDGLFKTIYAEKLLDLVPDFCILQKKLEFVSADKEQGDHYEQPVALSQEGGFTYLGSEDALVGSDLNASVAGVMKPALVKGSQLMLRGQLSLLALSRASKKGAKAFQKASAWKVQDMNNAARKRIEIDMLYGQSGLGEVLTCSAGTTSYTVVVSTGSWAPGMWVGSEGHTFDIFDTTLATRRNTAAITLSAVNVDTRTLTFTTTTDELDTCAPTDKIFYRGAVLAGGTPTHYSMAGLHKIITNTGSLFGIDAATYSLWKGNTYSSTGAISQAKVQDAIAKAVNKGLMEKVVCLVSPRAWGVLNSDASALRVFDSSYSASKSENGSESLVFHSTNGQIEIVAHPFVKEGDAFILPLDGVLRTGSTDITFGVPGMDEQFFEHVPNRPVVELKCMSDQAVFVEKPAHTVFMTGITFA